MSLLRPAEPADVIKVVQNLRPEDDAEVRAVTGVNPVASLLIAEGAEVGISTRTGEYLGLCGVSPSVDPNLGWVWMVGTTALEHHQIEFLRDARKWIAEKHEQFPLLANFVDARNELHIKWLKWSGFQFLELIPEWGVERRPFYKFARIPH